MQELELNYPTTKKVKCTAKKRIDTFFVVSSTMAMHNTMDDVPLNESRRILQSFRYILIFRFDWFFKRVDHLRSFRDDVIRCWEGGGGGVETIRV